MNSAFLLNQQKSKQYISKDWDWKSLKLHVEDVKNIWAKCESFFDVDSEKKLLIGNIIHIPFDFQL